MDQQIVTCCSVGVYEHALKRGNQYIVNNERDDKYRISGNHGRLVWISKAHFIDGNITLPYLKEWKSEDDLMDYDLMEVDLIFSDGSKRWCLITTPSKLIHYFEEQSHLSGFNIRHLLILKEINHEVIEQTLRYLEAQDRLTEASVALG
ncbi:hypothetical protein QCD85_12620 [Paenibacillus sp. PsM32]|uniref:hypothetical protein n=1 Tax=unclassified Paenibacillus TaxID=185978 RepID=UPI00263AB702|nr:MULTISPECIES: hypothetical protein [unclassified Paenibacillus]MDN4618949.1 hypothetical protein [Paenibacillus sp. PsM32]MDQ1235139.1 hypothetical protein [Paenibacillus sp. SORGH_AS_0306]MDR6112186.1 hypothetical protein [Paenibacillus sp. SORGH_AS_0338]